LPKGPVRACSPKGLKSSENLLLLNRSPPSHARLKRPIILLKRLKGESVSFCVAAVTCHSCVPDRARVIISVQRLHRRTCRGNQIYKKKTASLFHIGSMVAGLATNLEFDSDSIPTSSPPFLELPAAHLSPRSCSATACRARRPGSCMHAPLGKKDGNLLIFVVVESFFLSRKLSSALAMDNYYWSKACSTFASRPMSEQMTASTGGTTVAVSKACS
jgi:hypothetical protein